MTVSVDDTFTAVFQRHKDQVYDFAAAMVGDRDAAGDIVQEAFVRFYRQLRTNSDIVSPRNWLFVAVRNLCLNRIRDRRKEIAVDTVLDIADEDNHRSDQRQRLLYSALAALDPELREALVLREYQGISYTEMAEILETTVASVRSLLYRARKQLRAAYLKLDATRNEL